MIYVKCCMRRKYIRTRLTEYVTVEILATEPLLRENTIFKAFSHQLRIYLRVTFLTLADELVRQ